LFDESGKHFAKILPFQGCNQIRRATPIVQSRPQDYFIFDIIFFFDPHDHRTNIF
tara:strand:- start:136 stop:300 length:165 start_codon:yes stop_codon:yes gene_type:complete